MAKLRLITNELCGKCKYRMQITGTGYSKETTYCCDYMMITKNSNKNTTRCSRIFVDGKEAYDPKYCDKFEKGSKDQKQTWEDTKGLLFGKAKKCNIV